MGSFMKVQQNTAVYPKNLYSKNGPLLGINPVSYVPYVITYR